MFLPGHWRSAHLGGLRRAGRVDSARLHAVGLVPATQSEAALLPPLVAVGQRAVAPEHTARGKRSEEPRRGSANTDTEYSTDI